MASAVAAVSTSRAKSVNGKGRGKTLEDVAAKVISVMPKAGDKLSPQEWAKLINGAWRRSAGAILECARLYREARLDIPKPKWAELNKLLDFDGAKASKLYSIAEVKAFYDARYLKQLPPSFSTIYLLSQLSENQIVMLLDKGDIHPNMEREDAQELLDRLTGKADKKKAEKAEKKAKAEAESEPVKEEADDEGEKEGDEIDEPAPVLRVERNGPDPDSWDVALDNFDGSIDSLLDFADKLESKFLEKGKKLPADVAKRATSASNLLQRLVKKYS